MLSITLNATALKSNLESHGNMKNFFCNLFGKKKERKLEEGVITRVDTYIVAPKTTFWHSIAPSFRGVPWMDTDYRPLAVSINIDSRRGEYWERKVFARDIDRLTERARAVLLFAEHGGWDPLFLVDFARRHWYSEKIMFAIDGKWLDAHSTELFHAIRSAAMQSREPICLLCKWKNP